MKELTLRQWEMLTFIRGYITEHRYPPTFREIGVHFGFSVKGAYDHVAALKKKGYIRADSRSRTIELTGEPEELDEGILDIPILGTVAAGVPILAEENYEGAIPIPKAVLTKHGQFFALRVRGDSMINAGIMDGDMAIIEKQEIAENGAIVVAVVNEAITIKRFYYEKNRIRLQPENENYKPIYSKDVRLLGRLSKIIRSY
jgi:repressor LexA